ncbi:MAG: hypothetical protein ACTSPB_03225 [Candidatus Thorarchaeota archaeon]
MKGRSIIVDTGFGKLEYTDESEEIELRRIIKKLIKIIKKQKGKIKALQKRLDKLEKFGDAVDAEYKTEDNDDEIEMKPIQER